MIKITAQYLNKLYKLLNIKIILGVVGIVCLGILINSLIANKTKSDAFPKELLEQVQLTYKPTESVEYYLDLRGENPILATNINLKDSIIPKVSALTDDNRNITATLTSKHANSLGNPNISITKEEDNVYKISISPDDTNLQPSKYTLNVEIEEDGKITSVTQDFTWGVLALNTNKSIYTPRETAHIEFGVLNEEGKMACEAKLYLEITKPNGDKDYLSTENGDIIVNTSCLDKEVKQAPDFETNYKVAGKGTYHLTLVSETENGTYSITDSFEVLRNIPFDIERLTATRIYPPNFYPVIFKIKANEDYTGIIEEKIPLKFAFSEIDQIYAEQYADTKLSNWQKLKEVEIIDNKYKVVRWEVEFKKGREYSFGYEYRAPNVSPDFYLLGSLKIGEFEEARQWQIAVDATNDLYLFWDSGNGSVPTGWTSESDAGEVYNQRFIRAAAIADVGNTGGSVLHTHTLASTSISSFDPDSNKKDATGSSASSDLHDHGLTVGGLSGSNEPQYRTLQFIKSSGTPTVIPDNAIAIFESAPSGWTRYDTQDTYYIRSDTASPVTGGNTSNEHTHTVTLSLGAAVGSTQKYSGAGTDVALDTHTHTVADQSSNTVTYQPPFIEVLLYIKSGSAVLTDGMLGFFDDTPPTNWTSQSESATDYNNRFIKGAASFGGTGGGGVHAHNDMTGIASNAATGTATDDNTSGSDLSRASHTHTIDLTGFSEISETDNLPPYVNMVIASYSEPASSITVSGYVYTDEAGTPYDCSSNNLTIKISVDSGSASESTCDQATGEYSIDADIPAAADSEVVAYISNVENVSGTTITLAADTVSDISNLNIYTSKVSVSHEDSASTITNNDLSQGDSGDDGVRYSVTGSNLSVSADMNLYVYPEKKYDPGGTVLTQGTGDFQVAFGATASLDTASNTIADDILVDASATLTIEQTTAVNGGGIITSGTDATVTYSGTPTLTISGTGNIGGGTSPVIAFYDLTTSGSGTTTAASDFGASNDLVVGTSTTLDGTADITVLGGDVTGDGTIGLTGGTFTLDGTGEIGGTTDWIFNNLTLNGASQTTTADTGEGDITISSVLTVGASHVLDSGAKTWHLAGSGTPFVIIGSLTESTSAFEYEGTTGTIVTANDTYYNLSFLSTSGTPTFEPPVGSLNVTNNLIVGAAGTIILDAEANDPTIDVNGSFSVQNSDEFKASSDNAITIGGNFTAVTGTFTANSGEVIFDDVSKTTNVSGTNTFNKLTCTTAGKTLQFVNGVKQTINGLFTLTGTDGSEINLQSQSGGNQWLIDHQGTESISEVNIKDSGCDGASTDVWAVDSVDFGNNGTCWIFPITVSGNVYTDEAGTPYDCSSDPLSIKVSTNGLTEQSATCDLATGAYSVTANPTSADLPLVAYIDTAEAIQGTTVTLAAGVSAPISGLNIYQNKVSVTQESATAITNNHMDTADNNGDDGIKYAAPGGVLSVSADIDLYVYPSKTYTPGNTVLTQGTGDFQVANGATASLDTASNTIARDIIVDDSATLTVSQTTAVNGGDIRTSGSGATVTYSGTPTLTISGTGNIGGGTSPVIAFYDLTTSGSGTTTAASDFGATGDLVVGSSTTLDGTADITIAGGDATGDGTIGLTGGTFTLDGTGEIGGATGWVFSNLTLSGAAETTTADVGAGEITVSSVLTIGASHVLDAGTKTWNLTGSSTPFVKTGTLDWATSTFEYEGTAATNIATATYYNLSFVPGSGTPTYTLASGTLSATNDFTLGGAGNVIVTAESSDPTINVYNDFTIGASDEFQASSDNALTIGGNFVGTGTFTANSGEVIFDDSGKTTTVLGVNTFNDLTCATNNKTLQFTNAVKQTINGLFTLTGTNGNEITLQSDSGGNQWLIDHQGTESIDYVHVKDSGCDGASTDIWTSNSTNLGNNGTCWIFPITVSGNVYTDEGGSAFDCSSDPLSIKVSSNGRAAQSATCDQNTGAYSIEAADPQAGEPIVAYIENTETPQGTTVTLAVSSSAPISNLYIYQNKVAVSHENAGPITNSNLLSGTNGDAGIRYAVSGDALTTESNYNLYVWPSKTYDPGGTVVTQGTGDFQVANGATASLDTASNTIADDIIVDASATLTVSETTAVNGGGIITSGTDATITYSGTPTLTISGTGNIGGGTSPVIAFYDLTTSGSGTTTAASDFGATGDLVVGSSTTLDGTADIYISGGDATGDGTIGLTGGTFTLAGTGEIGGATGWTFSSLTLSGAAETTTADVGAGEITVSSVLTVGTSHVLDAGTKTWNLTGSSTPFVITGTLDEATSTFEYEGTTGIIVPLNETYYNLSFISASGTPTFRPPVGTLNITNNFTIGAAGTIIFDAETNDTIINVDNDLTIQNSDTYQASSDNALTIGGNFINNATFTPNTGTITFDDAGQDSIIELSGATTFYDFRVETAGKQMYFDEVDQLNVTNAIIIQGSNCTTGRVFLDSTADGNQWDINYTGATMDIDYADVEDSNAVAALTADNSTEDNTGNTGWTINEGVCQAKITISGYIFTNEAQTAYNCSLDTVTVKVAVNGAAETEGDCTLATGEYSIDVYEPSADGEPIIAYTESTETPQATTVTRALSPSSPISNFNLIQNNVIVRHEDDGPITNGNLLSGTNGDAGIKYSVTGSDLSVSSDINLFVYPQKIYDPGGKVTTQGSGDFHLGYSSTAYFDTANNVVADDVLVDSDATFYINADTLVTGGSITTSGSYPTVTLNTGTPTLTISGTGNVGGGTAPVMNFYHFSTSGSGTTTYLDNNGGSANFNFSGDLDVKDETTLNNSGNVDLIIRGGDMSGDGTIDFSSDYPNVTLDAPGTISNTSNWDLGWEFGLRDTGTITASNNGTITCQNINIRDNDTILDAGSKTWIIEGTAHSAFSNSGTLTENASTFRFVGAATVPTDTYYNLEVSPADAKTIIIASGALGVTNNFTIGGAGVATVNAEANDPTINIDGHFEIGTGDIFDASSTNALTVAGNFVGTGTFNANSGEMIFDDSGKTTTVSGANTFNDLTCATNNKTLQFANSVKQTINGLFTLTGTSGNEINLQSDLGSTQWLIDHQGTEDVSYVHVKDSGCDGASTDIWASSSTNQGNNGTCWIFPITVSGNVYTDEGVTAYDCSADPLSINVATNGGTALSATCDQNTGAFSVDTNDPEAGEPIVAYIDNSETPKGTTVTLAISSSAPISNFHIYQDKVVVRHENTGPISNTDLSTADNGDAGIGYTAPNTTLTTDSNMSLYVWPGYTYDANGTLTTQGTGDFQVAFGATAYLDTASNSIAGNVLVDNEATLNIDAHSTISGSMITSGNTPTVTYSGTPNVYFTLSTPEILGGGTSPVLQFYNMEKTGTSSLDVTSDISIANTLWMTLGTLTGKSDITVGGGEAKSGGAAVINLTGGTFTLSGTGEIGGSAGWTFNNLTLEGASQTTTAYGSGDMTVSSVLTVGASHVLDAGTKTWNLTGDSTPFVVTGTLDEATSTFEYEGTTGTIVPVNDTYYNLSFLSASGTPTFQPLAGTLSATNNLIIGAAGTIIFDAETNDTIINVDNDFTIQDSDEYKASSDNALTIGGNFTNNATFTPNTGTVTFDDSGQDSIITFSSATSLYDLRIETAGKQMYFDEVDQLNVTHGLIIQGSNCTTGRVFLDSTADGNQWDINYTGSTMDIDYADVEDSNAVAALTADDSTEDNTGNTGWTINEGVCQATITVSGYIYTDEAESPFDCSGETLTIKVAVNGAAETEGDCTLATGEYSIDVYEPSANGEPVVVYISSVEAQKGTSVTRALSPSSPISGFNIIQNNVIVRHEDNGPITNANLDTADNTDVGIRYAAPSDSLTVDTDINLYVYPSDTYDPGGTVVTQGTGDFQVAHDAVAYLDTADNVIADDILVDSLSTLYIDNDTLVAGGAITMSGSYPVVAYSAGTPTLTISGTGNLGGGTAPVLSFYNFSTSGSGTTTLYNGSGLFNMSVAENMNIGVGSTLTSNITGSSNTLTVSGGDIIGDGVINIPGNFPPVQLNGTGNFGGSSDWTFLSLDFSTAGTTSSTGGGGITITKGFGTAFQIDTGHTLNAGSKTWTIEGDSATILDIDGSLEEDTSTFKFTGGATIPTDTYYNLELSPATAKTSIIASGSLNVLNNFTLEGAGTATVIANTNDPTINIDGHFEIGSGDTFDAASASPLIIGGNFTNSGTFTANSGDIWFDDEGTTSSITGNTTFNNFSSTHPNKTLAFGSTQTINGLLKLTGTSGNNINVQSTSGGTQWAINHQGTEDVSYVHVKDSGCDGASTDIWASSSTNQGNNGSCWIFPITVSGNIYSDEGVTAYDCSADPLSINVATNGGTALSATCDQNTGAFSVDTNDPGVGEPIVAYIDNSETPKGTTVTLAASSSAPISNFHIYQDKVVVRHENTGPISNTDLSSADNGDAGIGYTAPNTTLTTDSNMSLYVWPGDTYDPNGKLITQGTGDFQVAHDAVAYLDTADNVIADDIFVDSLSTLYIDNDTLVAGGAIATSGSGPVVTYSAGTPTITISGTGNVGGGTSPVLGFYNFSTSGSGTISLFSENSGTFTMSASGDISVGTGTTLNQALSGSANPLRVSGGDITGDGILNLSSPSMILSGTGSFGGDTNWTVGTLTVSGDSQTTTGTGTGSLTAVNINISSNHTLSAGEKTWTIISNGASPLNIEGNLTEGTSTFRFTGAATVPTDTFYNLEVSPSSAKTSIIASGNLNVLNDFILGGAGVATVNAEANDPTIDVDNNFEIGASDVFDASSTNALTIGQNFTNNGTFNANSGTVTFDDAAKTSQLDYTANTTFYTLNVTTGGKQLEFDETHQTIVSDTLNIVGAGCGASLVYLDSMVNDDPFDINYTGSTVNIEYVDVEDSNAIVALSASNSTEVNDEFNTGWTITEGLCAPKYETYFEGINLDGINVN